VPVIAASRVMLNSIPTQQGLAIVLPAVAIVIAGGLSRNCETFCHSMPWNVKYAPAIGRSRVFFASTSIRRSYHDGTNTDST
jgi:hypothetical protein